MAVLSIILIAAHIILSEDNLLPVIFLQLVHAPKSFGRVFIKLIVLANQLVIHTTKLKSRLYDDVGIRVSIGTALLFLKYVLHGRGVITFCCILTCYMYVILSLK